jgi:hypothetical protein
MVNSTKRKKDRKVPPLVIACGGRSSHAMNKYCDVACSVIFLRPRGYFVRDIL